MTKRAFVAAACSVLLLATAEAARSDGPEDAAQSAAESWLALVDAGDYAGSWTQASKLLKGSVGSSGWAEATEGLRAPLGKLEGRRLKSRETTEKPPVTRVIGGKVYTWGHGQYVVLQYDTSFASRSVTETVVAMAESDGAWRVASYSLR
jgi:hypothetical protein